MKPKRVIVNDKMQRKYVYYLTETPGTHFHPEFKPELTPKQMLELGVFGGKYMNDCQKEFPKDWFTKAKLSVKKNVQLNFFKVDASLSLAEWRRKGWIYPEDPRGWFQWYCRYFLGRRIPEEDIRQIKRWKAIRRHYMAVKIHCLQADFGCRPRQRQALLHWAYDSRRI